ncbi:MAG: hypothetical protein DMG30_23710 [Acidobacteria bacterium]|nr:MAG: hypothetical protein DMG30_23710 [Acidobacteriota bacterium]
MRWVEEHLSVEAVTEKFFGPKKLAPRMTVQGIPNADSSGKCGPQNGKFGGWGPRKNFGDR